MKAICESLKTMFFIFSSVMILFVAGCGKVNTNIFDAKVIEKIQKEILSDLRLPFEIKAIKIDRDREKAITTNDTSFVTFFTAVAIATEDLYELVPPETDLKELMPGYVAADEISNVKSNLTAQLESNPLSTNDFSKTIKQYVDATNKINVAHSFVEKIDQLEPYSFVKIGVLKGATIPVTGTVSAIKSGVNEWVPAKIEVTGTELTGRMLFVKTKKKDSELIIEESGASNAVKKEIAKRKQVVSNAERTVEEALKALRKLQEADVKIAEAEKAAPDANANKRTTPPDETEEEGKPDGAPIGSNPPTDAKLSQTPEYDDFEMSELILTNPPLARKTLNAACKEEPNNPKHHYWLAFAYHAMGNGQMHNTYYDDARRSMSEAIKLKPEYKNDERVKETLCTVCKGIQSEVCKRSGCTNGKLNPKKCNSKGCTNGKLKNGKNCENCNGKGTTQQDCSGCAGTGKIKSKDCVRCDGTGKFFHKVLELE